MDAVIVGILIVVVTGVLVAVVRARAQKPKPPVRRQDESDILGVNILGNEAHDAWTESSSTTTADDDFFGH